MKDEKMRDILMLMRDEDLIHISKQTGIPVEHKDGRLLEDKSKIVSRLMGEDCEDCKNKKKKFKVKYLNMGHETNSIPPVPEKPCTTCGDKTKTP